MQRYSVVLFPEPEEGGFSVIVPVLPGCVTQGDTVEQALGRAQEAITGHIEALAITGQEIPEETVTPLFATVEVQPDLTLDRASTEVETAASGE
ncbi:MAG: type II toxin-antitoxin system HicB family antitoxin [Dehalococcoidia bacterium]